MTRFLTFAAVGSARADAFATHAQTLTPCIGSCRRCEVPTLSIAVPPRQSIANNTLDKKMAETTMHGGIVRIGIVHRTTPESLARSSITS